MNRKNFGQLIEVLRYETSYTSQSGKALTQKEMADVLEITLRHYGRLERGEVVNIEGDLLVKMAEAFNLNSRERHEFFYAAGGVSQFALSSHQDELQDLWAKLKEVVAQSIFPTFISDVLGNVLLAGKGALPVVGFDSADFLKLKYPNVLWASQHMDLSHAFLPQDLIKATIGNLQLIRGTSLRFRATNASRSLFEDLSAHPQFKQAWQFASQDLDMDFEKSRVFEQYHPSFDQTLRYFSLGSKIMTSWGDLYVTTFTPFDEPTFFKFKALKEEYGDVVTRTQARWPFPPKIG